MININVLLSTTPDQLAENQHTALKCHLLDKLNEITALIVKEKYGEVLRDHIHNSPSGDDHGCDNQFIGFPELQLDADQSHTTDIGDVLELLEKLKGKKRK